MTVTERFLKYVSFHTTSDEDSPSMPSTARQLELGKYLADELAALGLENAHMDDKGYVYAYLPASADCEGTEPLGLIAHMDTSPDVTGENVKARIVTYEGGDLALSDTAALSPAAFPCLGEYVGRELIVTDGTTLLGADDKAGVAEIVSVCEYLLAHPEVSHRPIAVCITPDEEIGRGTDGFTFEKFPAKTAYTVDGGELGEIEYENFNGAACSVEIRGVNIHPGSAKNKMKNAALLAAEFIAAMPPAETPAHTEGYEGFYHINHIAADESHALIRMILRDHDRACFEARKAFVLRLGEYMNSVHGEGTFTVTVKDSYYNMKERILPHMYLIENAQAAMEKAGVTPRVVPIRGGTDGAQLSWKGLPCPNLSTGGVNFHSIHEFIPVHALEKMVEVLVNLVAP